jgi:hypothetical protein
MLQHIANVRQAVRYAVSDFKGKDLPGFSLPKKVCACLNWQHFLLYMYYSFILMSAIVMSPISGEKYNVTSFCLTVWMSAGCHTFVRTLTRQPLNVGAYNFI